MNRNFFLLRLFAGNCLLQYVALTPETAHAKDLENSSTGSGGGSKYSDF